MSETWKQWERRTVDGRFPLQGYLGGSDHSAVFLTRSGADDSEKAAIKLIAADATDSEKQLLRWKAARELNHPNLIRIFEAGRCELDGTELLYVVEEYAEENLSQILPERALTAEEARSMLPPVLRALRYAHDKGMVHGHIQPSNILAIGDEVKLSSDTLGMADERNRGARPMGVYDPPEAATGEISAAADVWQLGMTLVEVLTRHLPAWDRVRSNVPEIPATVPRPLYEIAEGCLRVDAGQRWTVAEICDWLEEKRPTRSFAQSETRITAPFGQRRQSPKWPYLLGLAAVVVAGIFFLARPKQANPPAEMQSTQTQPGVAAEGSQSANSLSVQTPTQAEAKPNPAASTNADASNEDTQSGVARRVMPQVSPSARRTIQGKIKVRVKVEVDADGNVAMAKLESAGPSKYFSRIALEAARDWKFSPAQAGESGDRAWKLLFAFSRTKTEASAARAKH